MGQAVVDISDLSRSFSGATTLITVEEIFRARAGRNRQHVEAA